MVQWRIRPLAGLLWNTSSKDEHLIGRGNVHVVSQPNDMEAGGDLLNYYGLEQGKAVLTGNAWAVQYNNTLKSNQLTILLAKDGQAKVTE